MEVVKCLYLCNRVAIASPLLRALTARRRFQFALLQCAAPPPPLPLPPSLFNLSRALTLFILYTGKSNVIDALLFVFGKRSKQIRTSKVGELVHRSDKHPNIDQCEVRVYFQDIIDDDGADDGYRIVPNSEFCVTRLAMRNNTSRYYIDGKGSSFKEVTTLLSGKGIDLDHNRFLILQGEVESISLMKPKATTAHEEGLLEYLEDIIGSNKYVESIDKLYTEVEQSNDKRNTKLARCKLVEKELRNLEGAKKEAEAYLNKNVEILAAQSVSAQLNMADSVAEAKRIEKSVDELHEKRQEHLEQAKEKIEQLAQYEESFADETKAIKECEEAIESCKKEYNVFERKDVQMHEDLKNFANKEKKLRMALKKDEKSVTEKRTVIETCKADIESAEESLKKYTKQLAEAEKKLEQITKEETADLKASLEEKQTELEPLALEQNEAQSAYDLAKGEYDLLASKLGHAQAQIEKARASLKELTEKLASADDEIAGAQRRVTEIAELLPKQEAELEKCTDDEARLQDEVSEVRARLGAAAAAAESAKSQSTVMKALLKAKKQGLLKGIHGRLGDLGAIDAKYDVAVSTACGALNNVVVDTTETAQKSIKLLRKYNLGVATFVMLDKIASEWSAKASKECKTPEDAPRLFDLVTDIEGGDEHRAAFYFALRDTLVAPDLETANRWAFGGFNNRRWRVVTLQGQLIDTSGTMSGGGGRARNGAMRLAAKGGAKKAAAKAQSDELSAEDMKALETQLSDKSDELREVRARRSALEKEIQALQNEATKLESELPKLEMDRKALPTQISELEEQIPILEAQVGHEDAKEVARLKELEKSTAELGESLAAVKERASALEAECKDLESQILDAGGMKMRVQQSKVTALTQEIDRMQSVTVEKGVQLKNAEKAIAKVEARITKAEEELATIETDSAAMLESYDELKKQAQEVKEKYVAMQRDLEIKTEAVREKNDKHAELKKAVDNMRKLEIDLDQAMKEAVANAHVAESKAKKWRKEVSMLHKQYARTIRDALRDQGVDVEELQVEHDKKLAAAAAQQSAHSDEAEKAAVDGDDDEEKAKDAAEDAANADAADKSDADKSDASGDAEKSDDEIANTGEAAAAAEERKDDDDDEAARDAEELAARKRVPKDSLGRPLQLPMLTAAEISERSKRDVARRIALLEEEMKAMSPNMAAIKKYRTKEAEHEERQSELDGVTEERDRVRGEYDALRKKRLDEFMAGFSTITKRLKEMYRMITLGGDAELELVDSLDPFSEGILLSIRPKGKAWKNVRNLSGGEKTLSSLSLIFALHTYRPTPLYVLDEIDAALDFRNVSIIANYIKEKTEDAQFVVISLRSQNFELADRLVGIYKTNDCTRSVTIVPRVFAADMANATAAAMNASAAAAASKQSAAARKSIEPSGKETTGGSGADLSDSQQSSGGGGLKRSRRTRGAVKENVTN